MFARRADELSDEGETLSGALFIFFRHRLLTVVELLPLRASRPSAIRPPGLFVLFCPAQKEKKNEGPHYISRCTPPRRSSSKEIYLSPTSFFFAINFQFFSVALFFCYFPRKRRKSDASGQYRRRRCLDDDSPPGDISSIADDAGDALNLNTAAAVLL